MEQLVGTEYEGGQNWPEITMHMRGKEENYNSDLMANDIVAQLQENLGMNIRSRSGPRQLLAAGAVQERVPARLDPLVVRLPGSEQRLRRHVLQPEGLRQAPGVVERRVRRSGQRRARPSRIPRQRLEIYKQAERIIQEDVGYMPVVYRVDQYAFKPWVKDVPVNRQGFTVPDGNIYVRMLIEGSRRGTAGGVGAPSRSAVHASEALTGEAECVSPVSLSPIAPAASSDAWRRVAWDTSDPLAALAMRSATGATGGWMAGGVT